MELILSLITIFTLFVSGAGQVDAAEGRTPAPVFGCHQLTGKWLNTATVRVESEFVVTNGATLVDRTYHFGDGTFVKTNESGSAPALHTYFHPGEYIVSVVFRFNVNGQERVIQDSGCRVVADNSHLAPARSSYTCTALSAGQLDHTTYQFNMTSAYDQKGTKTTYKFNFGDGITATNFNGSVTYQFAGPGEYLVTAEAVTSVSGKVIGVRSGNCTVTVEMPPTDATADHRP